MLLLIAVSLRQTSIFMPKFRRSGRKDYRVADAAKKNPEENEEVVVTEVVEDIEDDLDDDDMENAEPPATETVEQSSDNLTEDKIEAGIDS